MSWNLLAQILVDVCRRQKISIFRPKAALFYVHRELGELAHRGAPSRNEISIPPNACGNLKTNKTRREAPRRNVMESKHTEAAAGRRAEDWGQK